MTSVFLQDKGEKSDKNINFSKKKKKSMSRDFLTMILNKAFFANGHALKEVLLKSDNVFTLYIGTGRGNELFPNLYLKFR